MGDFEKRALDYIGARQGELFTLLSNLIKFDTQNFITSALDEIIRKLTPVFHRKRISTSGFKPTTRFFRCIGSPCAFYNTLLRLNPSGMFATGMS